MHPKLEMWVQVICALRLSGFAKRKEFEPLAILFDCFHTPKHELFLGINTYFLRPNACKNGFT